MSGTLAQTQRDRGKSFTERGWKRLCCLWGHLKSWIKKGHWTPKMSLPVICVHVFPGFCGVLYRVPSAVSILCSCSLCSWSVPFVLLFFYVDFSSPVCGHCWTLFVHNLSLGPTLNGDNYACLLWCKLFKHNYCYRQCGWGTGGLQKWFHQVQRSFH